MKFFLLIIFILHNSFSYSENSKKDIQNYEVHKKKLIKRKLLINSFKKCEAHDNKSSVELFLNCNDKNKPKEQK